MKFFNSKNSSKEATNFAIMTTLCNIAAIVVGYAFCSRFLLATSFTPALFMTLLLFSAHHSFWIVGKKGKVALDRNTLIFWSLFAVCYIALGFYIQAAPSMLGVVAGIGTVLFVQILHTKIKKYWVSNSN